LSDEIAWYDARAETLADRYDGISPEQVHGWLTDLLPSQPATILDVGAGSGRDAAWLAYKGHDVVAIEPSHRLQTLARERHDSPRIQWVSDSLPGLKRTFRTGLAFDVILVSAVWMHVAPSDRARAFRKLITLLKPGGVLAITLRHGSAEAERRFHPVSAAEIKSLARDHGAFVEREAIAEDRLGRSEIRWEQLAVRLPDDGTGALPLLRHVILNDDKSSTYKLGLLRVVCRIADGAGGLASLPDDEHVAIPMGLVALTWIRLYRPLLAANMPQSPQNRHRGDGLGFAGQAFGRLGDLSHRDLSVGSRFTGDSGQALHQALRDVARTIRRMPAHYMTYPNAAEPILPVESGRAERYPGAARLDGSYLASFGTMRVPIHLWQAAQRFAVWIEPAIVAEWKRVTRSYAERQGRPIDDARLSAAMTWEDPARDVSVARTQAERVLAEQPLHCVWSGKGLSMDNLDVDHCFPWAVWPCGDLWNLLPTHRQVNQHEKGDRLPSERLLRAAHDRILGWWHDAYRADPDHPLAERFMLEAAVSLPGILTAETDLDGCYSALELQRLRLSQNQRAPEWRGTKYL
jgi:SAM-dependent methyltransferase